MALHCHNGCEYQHLTDRLAEQAAEIGRLRQEGREMLDCICRHDTPDLGDLNRWFATFDHSSAITGDEAEK